MVGCTGQKLGAPHRQTRRIVLLPSSQRQGLLRLRIIHEARHIRREAESRQSRNMFREVFEERQVQAPHHGVGLSRAVRKVQGELSAVCRCAIVRWY